MSINNFAILSNKQVKHTLCIYVTGFGMQAFSSVYSISKLETVVVRKKESVDRNTDQEGSL